jgi:hypothetical protein
MNSLIGYWTKGTFKKLIVSDVLRVGNQQLVLNNGSSFFVDSDASNASDSNSGTSWENPLATLDAAIGKCTANSGDVIYVAESHSESYTTTGAKATFDVAGVTVIGLGTGSDRPTFSFGHTGATWTISAANVTLVNLLFVTAVDSVVTYATISGADCKLIGCESRDAVDKEVVTDFTVTGDRLFVERHYKNGYVGGDANDCVFSLNGSSNSVIKDSIFITKVLTAVIEFVTAASDEVVIDNCVFLVSGTTNFSKDAVDTITGSTWIVTQGYDIGAGSKFSGGSGAALAGDDVSAVSTAVAALQTDLGDYSGRTNLQSSLALLGNPDAAGATTWSALVGSNVSYNGFLGTKVNKTEADILDGTQQAMFTVSGGRVLVTHIELEVTTAAVDAGANNTQILTNPTVGTDAPMCAVLDVDGDEAGTIYSITGKPGDAMVGGSGGGAPGMEVSGFVVPEGTIDLSSAGDGGTGGALIKAELWYIPLDSGASVASA